MTYTYLESWADISQPSGTYRYSLGRRWGGEFGENFLPWVMLNPSTADASEDDPTIKRVVGFSVRLGYRAAMILNLFAFRATDPRRLYKARNPIGVRNDEYLSNLSSKLPADQPIVCAWGQSGGGRAADRMREVLPILGANHLLICLGTTQNGFPRHPLYVPSNTKFKAYSEIIPHEYL